MEMDSCLANTANCNLNCWPHPKKLGHMKAIIQITVLKCNRHTQGLKTPPISILSGRREESLRRLKEDGQHPGWFGAPVRTCGNRSLPVLI
jgi:hypothetical protein